MILTKYNRELAHQMVDSAPDGHASAGINFDETSRRSMLERRRDEADFSKQELNNVPMTIFIG